MKRLLIVHLFAPIAVLVSALDSGDFEFSERTEDRTERILYSVTSCTNGGQTAVETGDFSRLAEEIDRWIHSVSRFRDRRAVCVEREA